MIGPSPMQSERLPSTPTLPLGLFFSLADDLDMAGKSQDTN